MHTDDATPTYRGYRRQALYALFRLFDNALPTDTIIQPEGNEDLAIYDDAGTLIEIVQVKDHSDNLAASSFKPSFYKRIASHCVPGSSTVVRIVSFGPIGPDLQGAVLGDAGAIQRVMKTITKPQKREHDQPDGTATGTGIGLPDAEARQLLAHITLTPVNEEELTEAVVTALRNTLTGVDARHAFDFLMWWLVTSSETRLRIDRSRAIATVERIGKFLAERAAYHDEWYTSIVPICASVDRTQPLDMLTKEFFRGGRVRFDHIDANLDIRRDRFLTEVHAAFVRANVVVIHSASGQGKTTLAYRYAKDCAPADFRFEVLAPSSLKHARQLALALIGHAQSIDVPTLVYVDVRPGDNYWLELVRELASVVGIRVLVTIREEDWSRTRIAATDFVFADVVLSFDKHEAIPLYRCLAFAADAGRRRHLDFDDAWTQFGDRKTLFEFVYYITQAESLAERVASQIDSLQDSVIRGERTAEELELLRLVAVASAYEARVDLASLLQCCQLTAPQRTIERFNDEYLVRVSDNGRYVEGFHSIRSQLISSQLTDAVVNPWTVVACRCLPLIAEADLETFLLCAFSRHADSAAAIVAGLDNFQPRSWIGIRGVASSLMWNGVRAYADRNAELVDEVFRQVNTGWQTILDWDLAQVCGKEGLQLWENLQDISPEASRAAEFARWVRGRQTDKDAVFDDVRGWLKGCGKTPVAPEDASNLLAMAETMFWIGHLAIDTPLGDPIGDQVFDRASDVLPIYLLGEFFLGVRRCQPQAYDRWFTNQRENVLMRLRRDAAVAALVEDDESVVAHYAIDLDRQASVLRGSDPSGDAKATLHDVTIERVELLSRVLVGKRRYGAIGYGHRMSLVSHIVDEADKPGVLANNLHPPWSPRFNALARGCLERRFRPECWSDYFRSLQTIREGALSALSDLSQAIAALKRARAPTNTLMLRDPKQWDECRTRLNDAMLLPSVAVDEWGFVTESTEDYGIAPARTARYSGLLRFAPVRSAVTKYTRSLGNFMSQALHGLVLVPHLKHARYPVLKDKVLSEAGKHGIKAHSLHLSVVNGVDACAAVDELHQAIRDVFGNADLPGADRAFCGREREAFLSTMAAWCLFAYGDDVRAHGRQDAKKGGRRKTRRPPPATKPTFTDVLTPTRRRLRDSLRALRKHRIEAAVLSETVTWNGKSALWIAFDTDHPIAALAAIETVWRQLVSVFYPDRDRIVRTKAVGLLWSSIIVVPLICGRSLEREAMPYFNAVTYQDAIDIQRQPWRLSPEVIPDDAWGRLELERWEIHPTWAIFDRFTTAYGMLFHHVDHMADFSRLPDELDKLGHSIVQSYLERETTRAQPLLQEMFDTCADVLGKFPEVDDNLIKTRPNICTCMQILVDMKKVLLPTPDFQEQAKLTMKDVVDWRDRLYAGLQQVGLARYLWIADSLGFGQFSGLH